MSMEASYQDRRIRDLEREVTEMKHRLDTLEREMREQAKRLKRSERLHTPHLDRMIFGPDR